MIKITPDKIFRGKYDGPNGSHCAVGWLYFLLPNKQSQRLVARNIIADIAKGQSKEYINITHWNDHIATNQQVADALNKTFEQMGL